MYELDRKQSERNDCLLGHSLMITPQTIARGGFMDVDRDDYKETEENAYFKKIQASQLAIIEDKWRNDFKVRVYKEQATQE